MNRQLLPGEEIISTTKDGSFVLTNKRVMIINGDDYKTAKLSKISCIEVAYKENTYYLPLAAVGFLVIVSQFMIDHQSREVILGGVFVTLLFIILYLLSRKHVVSLVTDAGIPLTFFTKGMGKQALNELVNKVESELDRCAN